MDTIVCENVFVSTNETEKSQAFNEVWQMVVNMIINK